MPYWTSEETDELLKLLTEGATLQQISEHFHRSSEITRLKVHRLISDEQWNHLKSNLSQRKTAPLPPIVPVKEFLEKSPYRPFEKKPSLVTPFLTKRR